MTRVAHLNALGHKGQLRSIQAFMNRTGPRSDRAFRYRARAADAMHLAVFRRASDPLYAFTAMLGFSRWR
jgi:hypothetical protein